MEQGFRMKEREKKAEKERKTAHGAVNRTGQDMKPPGQLGATAPGRPTLEKRQLPTLPHCIAVPSAMAGLTSLFGMGRGGTPPL